MRVDADAAGGAPRVDEWSSLVDPERADPAGDPGADRHHQCDGARRADVRPVVRRHRGASRRLRVRRAQRPLRLRLPQARVRAPAAPRSRRACCARCACRAGSFPMRRGTASMRVIARHGTRDRPTGIARSATRARCGHSCRRCTATLLAEAIEAAVRAHPAHPEPAAAACPRTRSTRMPEAPGVYRFYGDNPLPLYIGKSTQPARARRRAFLRRLALARPTCGCRRRSGASSSRRPRASSARCCAKRALVKALLPAHNRALRRKAEAGVLALPAMPGRPHSSPPPASSRASSPAGTVRSRRRRAMRETLRSLAREHALCWKPLGLESGAGARASRAS